MGTGGGSLPVPNGSWRNVTMRNISLLIKPVSGICNMTCDYCFYCDEAKKRTQHVYGMMNEKTLETIIEKTISEADAVASFTKVGWESQETFCNYRTMMSNFVEMLYRQLLVLCLCPCVLYDILFISVKNIYSYSQLKEGTYAYGTASVKNI